MLRLRSVLAVLVFLLAVSILAVFTLGPTDADLLVRAAGTSETSGPGWPGYGKVSYDNLSSEARVHISPEQWKTLTTWAAVDAAFRNVELPSGKIVNSINLPSVELGEGVTAAAEIVVIKEPTGWKLAKIRCFPRTQ